MIVVRMPPLAHFKTRALEWGIGGMLVSWAVVLAQPVAVFDQPQFAVIRTFAPQSVWAVACFFIGVLRLGALWVNGAWHPSPLIRAIAAALSGLFWLAICLGLSASGRTSTSLAIYPWLVIFDVYSVHRATQDARVAWENRDAARRTAPG